MVDRGSGDVPALQMCAPHELGGHDHRELLADALPAYIIAVGRTRFVGDAMVEVGTTRYQAELGIDYLPIIYMPPAVGHREALPLVQSQARILQRHGRAPPTSAALVEVTRKEVTELSRSLVVETGSPSTAAQQVAAARDA